MAEADVLEHLLAIRGDIAVIKGDIRELKNRLTGLQHGQATIIHHLATVRGMADARTGRVVSQDEVRVWANSLGTATPLPAPFARR